MNETSTFELTVTESRRRWEPGTCRQAEWIREMRPERKPVGSAGVFPPLIKKRVSHKLYMMSRA